VHRGLALPGSDSAARRSHWRSNGEGGSISEGISRTPRSSWSSDAAAHLDPARPERRRLLPNKSSATPIKLGRDLGDKVEILSSLDPADSLGAKPSNALCEGVEAKVQAQPSHQKS
jgi:hypothetical protein